MSLLSIFSRSSPDAAAASTPADVVDVARTKARRRLIGSAVLLGIGVIAFPLIFETQPRPIPVDIPIVLPAREDAKPLAMPAPAPNAAAPAAPVPVEPVVAAASTVAATAKPAKPANKLPDIIEKAEPPKSQPKPVAATKAAEAKPALTSAAASAPSAASAGRWVIQVGAYAEDDTVRDVRNRIERLGLRTYIQTLDTKDGKRTRVRVGPYNDLEETGKVAAKLKSAGLTASVLEL